MSIYQRLRRGFTLIELLIVVAIIAILAAIAVPNFLEAQVRAKVSRTRADLRTIVTGLEAYAVDYNVYPIDLVLTPITAPGFGAVTAESFVSDYLSTPISYLSQARLPDPFVITGSVTPISSDPAYSTLFYQNTHASVDIAVYNIVRGEYNLQALSASQIRLIKINAGWSEFFRNAYGRYKLGSLGPDQEYDGGANIYDPTNGTVSSGDMYRTSRRTEGGVPN